MNAFLLGWPKCSFGFFGNMVPKNPNELFSPPNIMYVPRSEIIWHRIYILSTLGDTAKLSSRVIVPTYIPTSSVCFSTSLPALSIFSPSNFSHSGKGIVELHL